MFLTQCGGDEHESNSLSKLVSATVHLFVDCHGVGCCFVCECFTIYKQQIQVQIQLCLRSAKSGQERLRHFVAVRDLRDDWCQKLGYSGRTGNAAIDRRSSSAIGQKWK